VGIELTHAAFETGRQDVLAGAAALRQDRDSIDARVSGFLASGWTGIAADSFVEAWDEWKQGAADVLEGLEAMADLLEATHRDLIGSDESSQQGLDQISARIVDRLG
jgi:WXG100 family type VII secretion target